MDIIISGEITMDFLIHDKWRVHIQHYSGTLDMIINDFTKLYIIDQLVVSGAIVYIIHEFGDEHEIIQVIIGD